MLCHTAFRSATRDYVTEQPLWFASPASGAHALSTASQAFTADQDSNTTSKQRKEVIMIIKIIIIIITHLALLSSLQSSPGFINVHGKIHAENENN